MSDLDVVLTARRQYFLNWAIDVDRKARKFRFEDLPSEARAFLEDEEFQERFCGGCPCEEDNCPCGMVPGDFWCRRRKEWQEVAVLLVEASALIATPNYDDASTMDTEADLEVGRMKDDGEI